MAKLLNKIILAGLCVLAGFNHAQAQIDTNVFDFSSKVKKTDYYTDYRSEIAFTFVDNKPVYDYQLKKTACYSGDKAKYTGPQTVNYSDYYTDNVKLKAMIFRQIKPGKYRKEKIKKFYSRTVPSDGIFYEDQVQQYFVLPGVKAGDCSQLQYACRGIDPLLSPRFIFNLEMPIKHVQYQITVPDNMNVRLVFVGDSTGITHSIKKEAHKTIHLYEGEKRTAIDFEEEAEDIAYYTPHLFAIPISYTVNGKQTRLAGSVGNLFAYYNDQIKKIDSSDNAELNKLSAEITKGLSDTVSKVKATYDWVQKNIKYVAFEEGPNGFIPRPADKILKNKYGDCKDKANLLINMLGATGIPAYYTWVGTRSKPYTYEQLPSPHVDNHMICSIHINGMWYYLDPTAPALEYRYPSAFIQGKEAFIRLNDTTYALKKIPVVPSVDNHKTDSLFLKIEGNKLSGRGLQQNAGYYKENCNYTILNHSNYLKQLKESIVLGNNKLSIDEFSVKNEANADLQFDYRLSLPDYLQQFNDEMYLNMNLTKDLEDKHINILKRKHGLSNEFKYELNQHINLTLPGDKTVAHLPDNTVYHSEQFSFEITYSRINNQINYDKKIRINHLLLEKENFKDWNDMIDKLNKAYAEAILLKSK